MNKLFFILVTLFLGLTTAPLVQAATTTATPDCQPIYGGGQTCLQIEELSLNLQFKNPTVNNYVDNLSATQTMFAPNQPVHYRLTIKNTAKRPLSNITATMIFPQQISSVSGGGGTYDAKSRKLTYPIAKLEKDAAKVFTVTGKIGAKETFPTGSGIVCTFTQALATVDKKTSQDNSQFCINTVTAIAGTSGQRNTTKGGRAVYPPSTTKNTPQTGPEMLALVGLLPAGAVGFWLRRKTYLT